jgi:acyl carrier protein
MNINDLVDRVRSIVGTVCGVEATAIRLDGRLAEYGFDSVRAMDLLVSLEEAFGIVIPDEVAGRMRTTRDVVAYLENKLPPLSTRRENQTSQGMS